MGLFKRKEGGKGLLGNLVSTVVGGISGIVSGVVTPLSSAATSIIKEATPMVRDVANSKAGEAFAAGLNPTSGLNLGRAEAPKNDEPKKDFFDYKNDDGSMNVGKIATHAAIALTGIGVLYMLAKKFKIIR